MIAVFALLVNVGLLIGDFYLHTYFPIPFNVIAILMSCYACWRRFGPKQMGKV